MIADGGEAIADTDVLSCYGEPGVFETAGDVAGEQSNAEAGGDQAGRCWRHTPLATRYSAG